MLCDNVVVTKVVEEAVAPENSLLYDTFTTLDTTKWTVSGNDYVGVTDAGQLSFSFPANTSGTNISADVATTFEPYAGKVSYELDFSFEEYTASWYVDPTLLLVRGGNTTYLNVQVNNKGCLRLMDGGSADATGYATADVSYDNVKFEVGKTYHVKVVVDPETDTYNLYVGEDPVVEGRKLRADATQFDGAIIKVTTLNTAAAVEMLCDNVVVTKVVE